MGLSVQKTTPYEDQPGVDQNVPENIKIPSGMGTFLPTEPKIIVGTGPIFNSQNTAVGTSEIKIPSGVPYELLANFNFDRLMTILLKEVMRLRGKDKEDVTENDRRLILRILHDFNPRKYPFGANDEVIPEIKKSAMAQIVSESNNSSLSNPLTVIEDNHSEQKESSTAVGVSGVLRPKKLRKASQTTTSTPTIDITEKSSISPIVEKMGLPEITKEKIHTSDTLSTRINSLSSEENIPKIPEPIREQPLPIKTKVEQVIRDDVPRPFFERMGGALSENESPKITERKNVEINISTPTTEKEVPVEQAPSLSQEKEIKMLTVAKLIEALATYRGERWMDWAFATPLSVTGEQNPHDKQLLPNNISTVKSVSWKDSERIKEIKDFLNDLLTTNEENFFTKYVPSYINPNNPSLLASVSGFSTYEIIHGAEMVYGLQRDNRTEISSLIKNMGILGEELGAWKSWEKYLEENPKLTIHQYYEQIRVVVALGDKSEYN